MNKHKNFTYVQTEKTFDSSISISRVVGMILIVVSHLIQYYSFPGVSSLGNVLDVGVPLFLFISGYIYGTKYISNKKQWLIKRWKRICFPLYIFMFFMFIYRLIESNNGVEIKQYFIYLFDLQGINRINKYISGGNVNGAGHLWFLTAIMLCYLVTLLLNRIDKECIKKNEKKNIIILFICIIIQCGLCYTGIYTNYILIFTVGYIFTISWDHKLSLHNYSVVTVVTFIGLAIRLYCKSRFDATILYDHIVVDLTHNLLAIWIFLTIYFTYQLKMISFDNLVNTSNWKCVDGLSYYIYITHYMFLVGPFSVVKLTGSMLINTIIFLVLVIGTSMILKAISKCIISYSTKEKLR